MFFSEFAKFLGTAFLYNAYAYCFCFLLLEFSCYYGKWMTSFSLSSKNLGAVKDFQRNPVKKQTCYRPNPGQSEKIELSFCFHTSLWCLKRFYEGLKGVKTHLVPMSLFTSVLGSIDIKGHSVNAPFLFLGSLRFLKNHRSVDLKIFL